MARLASKLFKVKRTIAIRLIPTSEQTAKLGALQVTFSAACNMASVIAFVHRCANRVRLHHLAYYLMRERFPNLGSQLTCNAIATVARSLKAHRANGRAWTLPAFKRCSSIHVDARTFRLQDGFASLFTMSGREHITVRMGRFQRTYLERGRIKEAEIVRECGRWYLHVVLDLPEVKASDAQGVLGVDLGENITAATSSGKLYGGGKLRDTRDRFLAFRARLQGNGSQSARQLLRRVSGRESLHVRHVNHEISAQIVREAAQTGCGTIILENLTNIRSRLRMRKRMRTRLHRWSWRQLQAFIEYKAADFGVGVRYVDPVYTSQTCSVCGNLGKRVRHRFSCEVCGIFAHSDRNAARNLAKIGASTNAPMGDVMRPHVAA